MVDRSDHKTCAAPSRPSGTPRKPERTASRRFALAAARMLRRRAGVNGGRSVKTEPCPNRRGRAPATKIRNSLAKIPKCSIFVLLTPRRRRPYVGYHRNRSARCPSRPVGRGAARETPGEGEPGKADHRVLEPRRAGRRDRGVGGRWREA